MSDPQATTPLPDPLPRAAGSVGDSPEDGRYADWKAPQGDFENLIWPDPAKLLADTLQNHRRLARATSVQVQNVPLPDLRTSARRWVGHTEDDRPLLATGHQTELYHTGVWVKDLLIHHAAAKLGGSAFHFAVDTDHPKHLAIRWPGETLEVTDDPTRGTAAWSGLLSPPTPAHLRTLDEHARGTFARIGYEPMLLTFLDSLRRLSLESASLSQSITNAQHQLDWELGLRQHSMVVSPILISPAFLALAHHVLSRPAAFAASYNGALARYRLRTGTRNAMRPMPDLFVSDHAVESPFWLDDLTSGTRTRPSVFRAGADSDTWILEMLDGQEFVFDPRADAFEAADAFGKFLTRAAHRLAPRALTLTLFLRLMVADQFVHGIGGGRYDQVTDDIIADHFGIEPPHFSVTTATMYFPGAVGRERVCMPCVLRQGHRLKHDALGDAKAEFLRQIAAAPRLSAQRAELFARMHHERHGAVARSDRVREWDIGLARAQERLTEEAVLFDRELFYAVQSRERLSAMSDRYAEAFAG